jgi:hypothetical protein
MTFRNLNSKLPYTTDGIPYLWESGDDFTTPTFQNEFDSSDLGEEDRFGTSVAVGNGRIVVGAPFDNSDGSDSGSAYIFNLDGTNQIKITASDGATNDRFGTSVAIGNGIIVIGSPFDDSFTGAAYIFDLNGTQLSKITASDGVTNDRFGYSVSVGSGRIVIGAYSNATDTGSAYIYELDGTGEVKITASDGNTTRRFGFSVSIKNGKIVVGSPAPLASSPGAAYIFDLNGTQLSKITASDGASGDNFGFSVAIGSGRIVIGAFGDDDNGSNSGSVYLYNTDGNDEVKITASDGASGDYFGSSVAVGSGRIVIGAYRKNVDGESNQGVAYIFDLDGNMIGNKLFDGDDGDDGDNFGYSVAVESGIILIGARRVREVEDNGGSAYLYETPQVYTLYDFTELNAHY